jgi:hypothetical protein
MIKNTSYALTGALLFFGFLFKIMHWPGAGVLLVTSLLGMAILLIAKIIEQRSPLVTRQNIACLLGVFYIFGVAFKIMHYPGAGIMLMVSMVGLSLLLAEFALSMRKVLHALLPLLFGVSLFFALFKIMHWPQPGYIMYGSFLAFSTVFPILLFKRAYELTSSSRQEIKRNYMIGGLIATVLLAAELKLTLYPDLWGTEVYQLLATKTLLYGALVLFLQRTRKLNGLSGQFKSDYRMLKGMQGIYLILIVMMVLFKVY